MVQNIRYWSVESPCVFFGAFSNPLGWNKPNKTLDELRTNIERELIWILVDMCDRLVENWIQIIDSCKPVRENYIEYNNDQICTFIRNEENSVYWTTFRYLFFQNV